MNGKDAFGVVLPHELRRQPVQKAEVVLLFGLLAARDAKRAGRAVLIQDDGWSLLARVFGPCLQDRDYGPYLRVLLRQIEPRNLAVGANDCPCGRDILLQLSKDVPQIRQRDDL